MFYRPDQILNAVFNSGSLDTTFKREDFILNTIYDSTAHSLRTNITNIDAIAGAISGSMSGSFNPTLYYTKTDLQTPYSSIIAIENISGSFGSGSFNPALYYTKTDLQTSGSAIVSSDNVSYDEFTYTFNDNTTNYIILANKTVYQGLVLFYNANANTNYQSGYLNIIHNDTISNTGHQIGAVIGGIDGLILSSDINSNNIRLKIQTLSVGSTVTIKIKVDSKISHF